MPNALPHFRKARLRLNLQRSMSESSFLVEVVDDEKLYDKLAQLSDSEYKEKGPVKKWFERLKTTQASPSKQESPLVWPRTKGQDFLGWKWRGFVDTKEYEFLIPARDKSGLPHAVDCLALGRLLEAVKNNSSTDLPQVCASPKSCLYVLLKADGNEDDSDLASRSFTF